MDVINEITYYLFSPKYNFSFFMLYSEVFSTVFGIISLCFITLCHHATISIKTSVSPGNNAERLEVVPPLGLCKFTDLYGLLF